MFSTIFSLITYRGKHFPRARADFHDETSRKRWSQLPEVPAFILRDRSSLLSEPFHVNRIFLRDVREQVIFPKNPSHEFHSRDTLRLLFASHLSSINKYFKNNKKS